MSTSGLRISLPLALLVLFGLATLLLLLAGRDISSFILWLGAAAISLALSHIVPILGERFAFRIQPHGAVADRDTRPIVGTILRHGPVMGGVFLRGVSVALLSSTVFAGITSMSDSVSLQWGPLSGEDIALFFRVFDSLAWWSFGALAALSIVEAAKIAKPILNETMPYPSARLLALGIAHILLATDGIFDSFLGIPAWFLLPIVMAMIVPGYLARPFRHFASTAQSRHMQWASRLGVALTSGHPPALVLFPAVILASITLDAVDTVRYADFLESVPLTDIMHAVNSWALVLFGPIVAVRLAATLRPEIGDIFPSPVVYLAILVLALAIFSEQGFLAGNYEYPAAGLMASVIWALLLLYMARMLKRIAVIDTTRRISEIVSTFASWGAAVMVAVGLSLPLFALLSDLPVVNALFLDYVETEEIGRLYQPYFAGIHSIRHLIAVLFFVVVLAWNLPESAFSVARFKASPMAIAFGFGIAGCLSWLLGLGLNDLGYGYTIAGTVVGTGFLTLAATQMASQLAENSNSVFADAIKWLAASRIRAFIPGASIALYILLLRPLIYDTLALAAAYEWLAILAAAAAGALRLRNRLQTEITTVETGSIPSVVWARHVQTLEARPDSRALSASTFQRQYVDNADWSRIWPYIMGLLCRQGVSGDSVQAAIAPLRQGLNMSPRRRGSRAARRRREEALQESLRITDEVLANPNDKLFATPNDQHLDRSIQAFIEQGDNPDATAAAIVAAYERRGARINHAVGMAFHLVNETETPSRLFGVPFVGGRRTRNASEKRERLANALMGHLSGERDFLSLPVALVANQAPLHRNQADALSGSNMRAIIDAGQSVEILSEGSATVQVWASNNIRGYVARANLIRLPILPADEAVLRSEYGVAEAIIEDDVMDDEIQQADFDNSSNKLDEKGETTT